MDTTAAFLRRVDGTTIEVVVNFGLLTGREATIAEVDRLARDLLVESTDVSIAASRRHELTHDNETVVHQVVVEATAPPTLAEVLRERCEAWALECAAERSLEPLGH